MAWHGANNGNNENESENIKWNNEMKINISENNININEISVSIMKIIK
jgi:hypothetical protein